MRKGFILSTAFAALLGVGVLGGASLAKETSKAIKAEASSTITIYCTQAVSRFSGGISVYKFGDSWGTFTPMTEAFINSSSQQVYKATIPNDVSGIIFITKDEHSSQIQSVDITTGISNNAAWYTIDDWDAGKFKVGTWTAHPYTINYYGNGSTSGEMASETAYADVSWGLTANAFAKTDYAFAGWNTKADGTGTSYSEGALIPKDSSFEGDVLNLYAQWSKTYPVGRYVVGSFCDWSVDGAILMDFDSQYTAEVSLSFGDEFKLADYNGSKFTDYYGYSSSIGGGLFCFSQVTTEDESYNNFKCWASGTYMFYSSTSEYESGKNISVEIKGTKWNAEQLAAKLMSFGEWAGHCGDSDRFPAMKTIYLGLSPTEQTTFQGYASSGTAQFKNAYDRYTAWASAQGENPWAEGKAASANIVYGLNSEDEGSTMVFIAVAAISALAFATLILIKKKRHN